MKEFLENWFPYIVIALAVCLVIVFILVLIFNRKRKKRFAQNALVKDVAEKMAASMLVKIQNAEASDCEADKVSMEIVRVFEDSFMMDFESIYFRHRHLQDLHSDVEKRLVAAAIAGVLEEQLIAKLPKTDPINGKPYKLTVEHKWEEFDRVRCAVVYACYVVPNENYIEIKSW
ncbi:MAG: hypothetical protein IKJ35_06165 [Clostridia bacterium]|nr:hypothetical protein [Clostridia bacterium]